MKHVASILLLLLLPFVQAVEFDTQDTATAIGAGLLAPDSSFYFIDIYAKHIEIFLTFDNNAKVEKRMRFADERLAEMRVMIAKNDYNNAYNSAVEYEKELAEANLEANKIVEVIAKVRAMYLIKTKLEAHQKQAEKLNEVIAKKGSRTPAALNVLNAINKMQNKTDAALTEKITIRIVEDTDNINLIKCTAASIQLITQWKNPITSTIKEARNGCEAEQYRKNGWKLIG